MQPRYYQIEAKDAVYQFFRKNPSLNPIVVLPTGTGKTCVISNLADDVTTKRRGRTLIVSHRKELIEQTAPEIKAGSVGIYSASLNQKKTNCDVTVAQIQSCYSKGCDFGRLDLCIVDECHLCGPDDDSMYQKLFADLRLVNPKVKFVGLTATPYRMREGFLCAPEGIWNEVAYEYPIAQAVKDGYLCPLISRRPASAVDPSDLKVVRGEFRTADVEALVEPHVIEACNELMTLAHDRNAIIVFCCSRAHARQVAEILGAGVVLGDMAMGDREEAICKFANGESRILVNVDCLTTGFNVPRVDCVAMMRPTASRGLYVQIAGRGMRLHKDKTNCAFYDFGGNIRRHGPIDAPYEMNSKVWHAGPKNEVPEELAKHWECPQCGMLNEKGESSCSDCGFERSRAIKHDPRAADEAIMKYFGLDPVKPEEWKQVFETRWYQHYSQKSGGRSMCVEYRIDEYATGRKGIVREWVCFEHEGFARNKAIEWWKKRSVDPVPEDVRDAVNMCEMGCVAPTLRIKVDESQEYPRITDYELGVKPPQMTDENWAEATATIDEEDLPF